MEKYEYAKTNIIQSLRNAQTYCSYLDCESELQGEIYTMIERLQKAVTRKFTAHEKRTAAF